VKPEECELAVINNLQRRIRESNLKVLNAVLRGEKNCMVNSEQEFSQTLQLLTTQKSSDPTVPSLLLAPV
jgi:hypothetical protein